jgi:hypothetical protein
MAEGNAVSVQSINVHEPLVGGSALMYPLLFYGSYDLAPNWDAADRDHWLRRFMTQFGNDLLQGVLATSVAKIQAQNFEFEGPDKLARMYRRIWLDESNFGAGYDEMIAQTVIDYYTQDNGAFIERQRDDVNNHEGPVLGVSHLDSARMYPTDHTEYPYGYLDVNGNWHLMHRSQFMRFVDLPSPVQQLYYHHKGFCALSRALSTAMVLSMLVAMKREKLSDLPPSALAIFNNINKNQFDQAINAHGLFEDAKGKSIWRSLLPLFGIEPDRPADVKFISLREVWDNFDEMTAYNVAAYSFAAAWRMDPREFWPVSAGPLGTGKEAEIQHEKAKAKSHGLIFTMTERQYNSDLTLPPTVKFRYHLQDNEEEAQQAQIHQLQIGNVKAMQDAGAQLSPEEVRYLLTAQYRVLPAAMAEMGAATMPDVSYYDDVDRQSKEYHGLDFGPIITIDASGKTVIQLSRRDYRISKASKQESTDIVPISEIRERIGKMPNKQRKAVGHNAQQITKLLGGGKKFDAVEAIAESEFEGVENE